MALFVSLEGGEGSGKSTQCERLARALGERGVPSMFIHEPGSTRLGYHIRDLIKGRPWGGETISPTAELFLFAAARAELVDKLLEREMRVERLVIIADRYADSTTAYQGYGRRLPLELVRAANRLATGGLMPRATFLLDCPPMDGLMRVGSLQTLLFDMDAIARVDEEAEFRRFEEEPIAFHERVRKGYLTLARAEPSRWTVIDGSASEDEVFAAIWGALERMDEFRAMLESGGATAAVEALRLGA